MIIREAIVLAGGLGTRLKAALPDTPKCLAPINNKPFIWYLVEHLQQIGIERFVFALGYKADMMISALNAFEHTSEFIFSIEEKPLGTGGAINQALQKCSDDNVLIVNGDTFFNATIKDAIAIHEQQEAICTLLLKAMDDCSRYGTVTVNDHQQVTGFGEKNNAGAGFINAGMYLLNSLHFTSMNWPGSFSFEKDFLQAHVAQVSMYAVTSNAYFIDIGIPDDYARAIKELPLIIEH